MMEAVRTSETSVDQQVTRQDNPEDSAEQHTRRRENLKSHNFNFAIQSGNTGPLPAITSVFLHSFVIFVSL
jgi:hypothetical protein